MQLCIILPSDVVVLWNISLSLQMFWERSNTQSSFFSGVVEQQAKLKTLLCNLVGLGER